MWADGSITHSLNTAESRWQVDWGAISNIDHINTWNRMDNCCQERVSNFYLLVSDTPFNSNSLNGLLENPDTGRWYYEPAVEGSGEIAVADTDETNVGGKYRKNDGADTQACEDNFLNFFISKQYLF